MRLPERLTQAVGLILNSIGVPPDQVEAEISEMRGGYLATTSNRRVLGSLNDFVFHFEQGVGSQAELNIHQRTLRLAHIPCAALEYAYPSEATLAAFASVRALEKAKNAG
jgi:hypothetical protein